jgi:hypothetical protein
MKTIYSLLSVGCFAAACLAIPAAASAQTAPAADATGTWNASFSTQNGVIPATLTFKKAGDRITGTIASDQGSSELQAEVKGKALSVWFNYNANGQSIPIEMSGTIDGDSAKGTMTAGGSPAGDWTATREKDTKEAKDTKDPKAASSTSAASLTGDWTMSLQLDQINATPALTLKQDGEKLTGTYTSQQYGKFPLTGTVKGSEVAFAVTLSVEGNSVAATYAGKVQADGTIAGSVDIGGMMSGAFTAARAK